MRGLVSEIRDEQFQYCMGLRQVLRREFNWDGGNIERYYQRRRNLLFFQGFQRCSLGVVSGSRIGRAIDLVRCGVLGDVRVCVSLVRRVG